MAEFVVTHKWHFVRCRTWKSVERESKRLRTVLGGTPQVHRVVNPKTVQRMTKPFRKK